jgi:hypothetical protein
MKTNWEQLSKKLGILNEDGSESFFGNHSSVALEEILGDEWLFDTLQTFIVGGKGNDLAIKTLGYIRSEKAAKMAFEIFVKNRHSDIQKARIAIWALSTICVPSCMEYITQCIGDERYEAIAIAVLRNLIFDNVLFYDEVQLNEIFDSIQGTFQDDIAPLRKYVRNAFSNQL